MADQMEPYVNQLLGNNFTQAAIIRDDGSIQAHSEGFEPSQSETEALVELFKHPSQVFDEGLTLAGTKYLVLNESENFIYARKGGAGAVVARTGQKLIIIGIHDEKLHAGNATEIVTRLCDFLTNFVY